MSAITLRAPAKVNLRLRVLARETSGYHQLETVFQALELADTLEAVATPGEGAALTVEGADVGPVHENLVTKAARAFTEATGLEAGARFRLVKRIAAGTGLGGGSSDAAAALRALNALNGEPLDRDRLLNTGARIGADVPFFLCGSPLALGRGRGERLAPWPPLPRRPVLVAIPTFRMATADAYRALDDLRSDAGPDRGYEPADPAAPATWDDAADLAVNDFEKIVLAMHPVLRELRAALVSAGARPALLAGSGSAMFGVFTDETARDRTAEHLAGTWPDVDVVGTHTATGVEQH